MVKGEDKKLLELNVTPVVIHSHPRSGTHLLIDTMRRQFLGCDLWKWPYEPLNRVYLSLESLFESSGVTTDEEKALSILSRGKNPIIKTHYLDQDLPIAENTSDGKIGKYWYDWIQEKGVHFYIYRDGRDVMCSYKHWREGFDPQARVSMSEFLRTKIDGYTPPEYWAFHVTRSLSNPGMIPVAYEELVSKPKEIIDRAAEAINQPPRYKQPFLPERIEFNKMRRIFRRVSIRPKNTIIDGRHNGRPPGKWADLFSESDCDYFHEKAGDVLISLGYVEESR